MNGQFDDFLKKKKLKNYTKHFERIKKLCKQFVEKGKIKPISQKNAAKLIVFNYANYSTKLCGTNNKIGF